MPDAYDNFQTYAREQVSYAQQQFQESSYPVLQAQTMDHYFTYNYDHRIMSTAGSYSPSSIESPMMDLENSNLTHEQLLLEVEGLENEITEKPAIQILVQPIDKFRFRYKSEMQGTHGCLLGEREDSLNKKEIPTVKLINCTHLKNAVIRCTLVTADEDRRYPHPHHLVRKDGSEDKEDPHDIEVSDENDYTAMFSHMGIIHTAKKDIKRELLIKRKLEIIEDKKVAGAGIPRITTREEVQIASEAEKARKWMNLNQVALCFQGFSYGADNVLYPITDKVYSRPINNLKSALTGELKITRINRLSSPVEGNAEVWLLVEKVGKKNIKVKFYELDEKENIIWEGDGKFSELDVHHQYAIVFKTPPYRDLLITKDVEVFVRLERPSDNEISNHLKFVYKPSDKVMNRKRARLDVSSGSSEFSQHGLALNANLGNTFSETFMNLGSTLPELSNLSGELKNLIDEDPNKSPLVEGLVNNETDLGTYFSTFYPSDSTTQQGGLVTDGPCSDELRKYRADFAEDILRKIMSILHDTEAKRVSKLDSISKIQALLLETTNYGDTPLHFSIRWEQYKIAEAILLILSADPSFKAVVKTPNSSKKTPLHLAVCHNKAGLVRALLKLGADPNACDEDDATPLHHAVMADALACIKELSESSSKLNLEAHNEAGWSALHLAVKSGSMAAVRALISAGADVNGTDMSYGRTALHIAVDSNHKHIMKYLLTDTKIDINKKNFGGNTALHNAVARGGKSAEELVSILKAHGADPAIRNHSINRDDEEEEEIDVSGPTDQPELGTSAAPTIKSEGSDSEDDFAQNGGESSFDLARDDPKLYELLRGGQSLGLQDDLELKEESEDEIMLQDRVKARVEAQVRKAILGQQGHRLSAPSQISSETRTQGPQIPRGVGDEKLTDEHVERIVPILNRTGKWVKLAEHTNHGSLVRLHKKTSSPSSALFVKIRLQNPDITVRQVKKYLIDIQAYEAASALEGKKD